MTTTLDGKIKARLVSTTVSTFLSGRVSNNSITAVSSMDRTSTPRMTVLDRKRTFAG